MKTEGLVCRRQRAWARALVLVALGLSTTMIAPQAEAIIISEFPASVQETGGMVRMPGGEVWVAASDGLKRMAPDGTVTSTYGTLAASNLALGPDGALWFSQPALGDTGTTSLGRLTVGGIYSEHPIATPEATVRGLTAGSDGNLWFSQTVNGTYRIARMKIATGAVTEFVGPTAAPGAMALGPDGAVWFAEGDGKVGRVTPTGAVSEMPLLGAATKLAFAPGSPFGYFVAYGHLGQITPAPGGGNAATVALSQGMTGNADNQDIAIGLDGNAWFTETADGRVARVKPSGQITEFTSGLTLHSEPHAIIAGPGPTMWFSDTRNGRIGRIILDPPQALTGEASALTTSGATLSAAVLPRGAATSAHFELGLTAAYGTTTEEQSVGDGDVSALVSAVVKGLAPGTTYHYRVLATSPIGTASGADRTLTTAPSPPPVSTIDVLPVPPPDQDSDGYPDGVDCGPTDAAIHPGATEVPGNAIDEDCAGGPAPYQRFFPHIDATFDNHGRRFSIFTRMVVDDVPAGASFLLRCQGRGCGFSTWSSSPLKRATKRLNLLPYIKRSHLRPRSVLELRLMAPGQIATVVRWTVGPPPRPVVTCLYPGMKKVQKCPR